MLSFLVSVPETAATQTGALQRTARQPRFHRVLRPSGAAWRKVLIACQALGWLRTGTVTIGDCSVPRTGRPLEALFLQPQGARWVAATGVGQSSFVKVGA